MLLELITLQLEMVDMSHLMTVSFCHKAPVHAINEQKHNKKPGTYSRLDLHFKVGSRLVTKLESIPC